MLLAGAGFVIVFCFLVAAMVVIGIPTIAYAAHSFLTVVEFTAAGQDDVRWPDESLFDWLWKPIYLLWLLAFWSVPAWVVVDGILTPSLDLPAAGFYPVLLAAVCLLFPLGLFSSLSTNNRLNVFRPAILRSLARRPLPLGIVYLASGVLVIGWGALFYHALASPSWWWLPLVSTTGAAVLLLYARLLGRLGWLITHPNLKAGRKGGKKKRKAGAGRVREDIPLPAAVPEPTPVTSALPVAGGDAEEEDEWAPARPYLVKETAPPATAVAAAPSPSVPAEEPEDVSEEEPALPPRRGHSAAVPEPPARDGRTSPVLSVSQWEERHVTLDEPPPPPRLWGGVCTFPFYPTSLSALVCLSLTGLFLLLILRGMMLTWPFGR
jgi:hypothetical protein